MTRPVVAVIGGGFSGLLTTLNLLRLHPSVEVHLIEKRGVFGLGQAYATGNPKHLLNVRLGNMSAFRDRQNHLLDWLATQPDWQASDEFINRDTYGRYLTDILEQTITDSENRDRLYLIHGVATKIQKNSQSWRVELDDHTVLNADVVVLAQGNLTPAVPTGLCSRAANSSLYFNNPWFGLDKLPDTAENILVIGSGLTMVDIAISLRKTGRKFTAISRHGLLPRSHGHAPMKPPSKFYTGSPLQVYRQVRAASSHHDWRSVLDDLRHSARSLWSSWTMDERSRFLRHLRVIWDNRRHRLAPSVAREVKAMLETEELVIEAGRIQHLRLVDDKIEVGVNMRGDHSTVVRSYDAVINCTGPQDDISSSTDPLLRNLVKLGLAVPAPLSLGYALDEYSRLRDQNMNPHTGLFAIGPLTRSLFWEATAVPDLREQAAFVAKNVAATLVSTRAPNRSSAAHA